MSAVVADISMSLGGRVTGAEPSLDNGLGTGGEPIQRWAFSSGDSPKDRQVLESAGETTGAVIMGRRTFDFVDGPNGWNDDVGYAFDHDLPARSAAGDRETVLMGGAEVIDQALAAGLVDILRIHLSPVVTPHATHLTYRVKDS